MPTLNVNGSMREFEAESETPLLWVIWTGAATSRKPA